MRLLSTIILAMGLAASAHATTPSFINTDQNHIEGNLPKFKRGLQSLEEGKDTVLRILHIGDSHIQAEMVTNELRRLLQQRYGNAGRGFVAPLRLAGTNQSHDYAITRPVQGTDTTLQTRLLKFPWPVKPGVGGVAVKTSVPVSYRITPKTEGHSIKNITNFTSQGISEKRLEQNADSIDIDIPAGVAYYGSIIENGKKGILYSAIGNNGACFTDYSLIDSFPQTTAQFDADLIILSMGTNEGFSTMTDEEIRRSVENLTTSLRFFNPEAEFLILAPMECQKNRNHGHKPLSEFYDVNQRVVEAKDIILSQVKKQGIPYWDFYTVAGGEGASTKWLEQGLLNKDRIHLYKAGYELMARLLFDALTQEAQ